MSFSTPKFWYKRRGLLAYLFLPFSWFYQQIHKINQYRKISSYKADIPVICVGNAIAGGGGKTPTVMALIQLVKTYKIVKNPYIISRGYGGDIQHSHLVDITKDTAQNVGDEPLLLAHHAPVIIGKDRQSSIKLAQEKDADLIIMDDGFFNHSIFKDIKILVIDRNMDFGNGLTLPAGPLREPLKSILPKTDYIITIGPKFQSDLPVFESKLLILSNHIDKKNYIGFCGIGFPEKFKSTLYKSGYELEDWYEFADHHMYCNHEIKNLLDIAKNKNCRLITTAKDYVKIPARYKEMIDVLDVELKFEDEAKLIETLKQDIKLK